jgi:aldehyde dehydrogenase (NAD+)
MDSLSTITYDSDETVREKLNILRKGERSLKMRDVEFRKTQLKLLRAAFVKNEKLINQSNEKDLGLKEFISYYVSFSQVKLDLDDIINNIDKWTQPRPVDTPALLAPAKSYVLPEPFGVCLIMSAWNSQFQTLIIPLAQAIAAGNCVLAKPSEMAEQSAIVSQIILSELDPEVVQVCQGGAEVCIELLKNRFDIILFTGSPQKGVLVAKAAAEFLTPCILELGGQNPVIVDKSVDLESAAYNLMASRFMLAGQVCIAPEYVMVEREVYEKLLECMKNTVKILFGENPKLSADYSRIINDFHTERLINLVNDTKGKVIVGGDYDLKEKYIAPTVVSFESLQNLSKSPLSCSEIFGPILYIAPYDNINDCIQFINQRDKPLALYYFGNDITNKNLIKNSTSSGAFVTNDCVIQFINSSLPFGGVGKSGYSAYHGVWGFDNLSHLKPVMERPARPLMKMRYPPFDQGKQRTMKFCLNTFTFTQYQFLKGVVSIVTILMLGLFRNIISDNILPIFFKR